MKVDVAAAVGKSALFNGVDAKDMAEIVAAAVPRSPGIRARAKESA